VQRQIVTVVSSRPNPSKVIETFWLHFRTSHLGIKFFEDLNLLGCDTVWVAPDISNDTVCVSGSWHL
jgi:hypothetical protein